MKLSLGQSRAAAKYARELVPSEVKDSEQKRRLAETGAAAGKAFDEFAAFLEKMHGAMERGGRIAIMGPNYRYCADEYWDCADHYVALTHVAITEHLYAAGFEPQRIVPRYLPYSFRGILPPSRTLTRLYLRMPLAWRALGKQFLVIGRKE